MHSNRFRSIRTLGVVMAVGIVVGSARAGEWSGEVAGQARLFLNNPLLDEQHGNSLSLRIEPEYFHDWLDTRQRFVFHPFLRLDRHDPERTHFDLRELFWEKIWQRWELRIGIRKVFWGVTESRHLVDIINQTDLVEDIDGEDKLGQPMINLARVTDWGVFDLFALPGFRERTFPGREGRFRPTIPIDTDDAEYESGAEDKHVDWALRWSRSVGPWDLGLAYFYGTSRDPRLTPTIDSLSQPRLVPFYDLIHQVSLDAQVIKGAFLGKLEALTRSGQGDSFFAAVSGFEYTIFDVFDSGADFGILMEYLYDSRGESAPHAAEDDLFLGTRVTLNDIQSTNVLAGVILDLNTHATFWNIEASRRLGNSWTISVQARAIVGTDKEDPSHALREDDYLEVELGWHF